MYSYLFLLLVLSKSEFEIDGFTYNIYDSENKTNRVQIVNCSITSESLIRIPPIVNYQSNDYEVISISSDAFSSSNISQFEYIYFPYTLIEIEPGTFSNFKNLRKIGYINEENELVNDTLPPQLTLLSDNIFTNCEQLTTLDTNNVIELGKSCLQFCIRLATLKIPSVEVIGQYSVASIQLLQTIKLPSILREIQDYAFARSSIVSVTGEVPNLEVITAGFFGCSELLSIPKLTGIDRLESQSFGKCYKLREIECGPNLTTIFANCFTGCSGLETFKTSSKSLFISMEAFSFCESLKKFNFEGVIEILNNAFEGCTSLDVINMSTCPIETVLPIFIDCGEIRSLILPPNLTEFDTNIFEGSIVHSITFSGTKDEIDLTGAFFEGRFDLYEVIFAPSCKANFFATFASCYSLSRVVLPTSPYSLYDTFSHCLNLTEVVNLEFCISLDYAFFSCEKLTHFDGFPQLENLGNQTFMNCKSLVSIPKLDKVKIIGKNCFKNCFSLKNIECGGQLEAVGADSFYECLSLENFLTSSSSYAIEPYAFVLCNSLKTFDFSHCNRIDFGAFQQCESLFEVDLSKTNFLTITFWTFSDCINLNKVIFPSSLQAIEEESFANCVNLTTLDFSPVSKNFSIFENAFKFCIGLKTVIFNTQPVVISEHAFYCCTSLESVYLKSSESFSPCRIEDGAFENCTSLKNFEFDKWSIMTIEQYAFYGCPLSKTIKFNNGETDPINLSISSHAFSSSEIDTLDFRFEFSVLELNEKSFSGCENVKCVMINDDNKNFVSSFFKSEIINGFHCSNFIRTHLVLFILFVSLAVIVLIFITLIIVCAIKRRKQNQINNSQPLLSTQATASYN